MSPVRHKAAHSFRLLYLILGVGLTAIKLTHTRILCCVCLQTQTVMFERIVGCNM